MSLRFLGIDGGGTRTRAAVLDETGEELGRVEGSASLVDPSDPGPSVRLVLDLARGAAEASGTEGSFKAMWAGLAGAGSEPARSEVEAALRDASVAEHIGVGTDAEAAFFEAFGDDAGILLVAGTGSIVLGRGPSGTRTRVGGWGLQLGDEGSGYALSLAALRGIARARDGRGPATVLEERILSELGLAVAEDLILWVSRASKGDVAALSPLVCAAAEEEDELACALVETAVEDLVGHVLTAIRKLGPWNGRPKVAFAGGLVGENRPLRYRVQAALSGLLCQPVTRPIDPASGAAKLAMRLVER